MQETLREKSYRVEELPYSSDIFSLEKSDPYQRNRKFLLLTAATVVVLSTWICAHGMFTAQKETSVQNTFVNLYEADALAAPKDTNNNGMPFTRAPQPYDFSMNPQVMTRGANVNAPYYLGEQGVGNVR